MSGVASFAERSRTSHADAAAPAVIGMGAVPTLIPHGCLAILA